MPSVSMGDTGVPRFGISNLNLQKLSVMENSTKQKIRLDTARAIVTPIVGKLSEYCTKCSIGGSVRRQKHLVGDLEIVCIPSTVEVAKNMFDKEVVRSSLFVSEVKALGKIIMGCPAEGKMVRMELPSGMTLDLFMATEANYGYILMLRTGSAEWNQAVMLKRGKNLGLVFRDGYIWDRGKPCHTPDEEAVFRLINTPFIPPQLRKV